MALTQELLASDKILATLTEEQVAAIVNLSAADENTVIGTRIGELHSAYERDILALTGITKNQDEKAYDYNKRVLSTYKNNVAKTLSDIEALKTEKSALEKQIADGSVDTALKTQVASVQQQLVDAQSELAAKTARITELETESKTALKAAKVDFQFALANKGVSFKKGYSDAITGTLLQQAKSEMLHKYTPDFVEDAAGVETLVFRDKDTNEIARNPKNGLQPYNITDLYDQTIIKDALDRGRQQPGAGTDNPKPARQGGSFDLAGAKTQVEADNMIYNHLMEKGLARGTSEFASEQSKLRKENKVETLPLR